MPLSPLHDAAQRGDISEVEGLLRKGASVHDPDKLGDTCLHAASEKGHLDIAWLLLEKGGERLLMAQNRFGGTCLHAAARSGHIGVARLLAERGGSKLLMFQDTHGWTCLHSVSQQGHYDVAKLLLDKGGEKLLMVQHRGGWTCLHAASARGHLDVSRLLLQRGGSKLLMVQHRDGKTALDVAKAEGKDDVAAMLEAEMAKHKGCSNRPSSPGRGERSQGPASSDRGQKSKPIPQAVPCTSVPQPISPPGASIYPSVRTTFFGGKRITIKNATPWVLQIAIAANPNNTVVMQAGGGLKAGLEGGGLTGQVLRQFVRKDDKIQFFFVAPNSSAPANTTTPMSYVSVLNTSLPGRSQADVYEYQVNQGQMLVLKADPL